MHDLVAQIQDEQRRRWNSGQRVLVEELLDQPQDWPADAYLSLDLICSEVLLRRDFGEHPEIGEYAGRFPQHENSLRRQFELFEILDEASVSAAVFPCPAIPGYEILERLGSGSGGVVYKARQESLNRFVALKLPRPDLFACPEGLFLFRREAESIAMLQHPNIVQVFDFGEHAGQPYIAMEFVEGGSLQQKLTNGPLNPLEVAGLIETLAHALHAAHEKKIVHRDLKPANVLLTQDGTVKLTDFGLAKRLEGEQSLAPNGVILGTVAYMAPEQAAAKASDIGPAADIYALGVILYESLSGQTPFAGSTWHDTLNKLQLLDPPPLRAQRPEIPCDLEAICLKCLEKKPTNRYSGADSLADDLHRWASGKATKARPRRWYERTWRACVARPYLTAAVILFPIIVFTALNSTPKPDPEQPRHDPEQSRHEVERAIALGQAVRLQGNEPLPGPFRWVAGTAGALRHHTTDGCVSIQSITPALVELVADPGSERYRFSVQVRHDDSGGSSNVGIYFGYSDRLSAQGTPEAQFFSHAFADRGTLARNETPDKKPVSRVTLKGHFLKEKQGKADLAGSIHAGTPLTFEPALPVGRPGPWRRLAIEVTPEAVTTYWAAAPALPMEKVSKESFKNMNDLFSIMSSQTKGMFPSPISKVKARSGLGLYVWGGEGSFRDIVLEPMLPQN